MTANEIEAILKKALGAAHVVVRDDSELHQGHAGNTGGGHYSVLIVASCFSELTLIARHKLVYDIFAQDMGRTIHALSLKTVTPLEYKKL